MEMLKIFCCRSFLSRRLKATPKPSQCFQFWLLMSQLRLIFAVLLLSDIEKEPHYQKTNLLIFNHISDGLRHNRAR
ncbi:protein of unknown function [Shewanella benthica]|uniref:Uncharacterized protein n=1 Tax=Shewanella benthica TaxID=43661 RepID=A0A330M1X0_9GAMM|nr:protein of unknown function [Shewanella benthica]